MNLFFKLITIILIIVSTNLNASQEQVKNIAKISASSLYNIDKTSLQKTIDAYIQGHPNLKGLKIVEVLSGETYYQMFRENGDIYIDKKIPRNIKQYDKFTTKSKYENEIVGEITAYFKSEDLIPLTSQEQAFISSNPIILVQNEQAMAPLNFHEFGKAKGFSVELMELIAKKTGLKVRYIHGPPWKEFINMIKNNHLDVMLNIVKNKERSKFINFTDPYANIPHGVILKQKDPNIKSFNDLINQNKTITYVKGYFYEQFMKKNYPNAKVKLVENDFEALQALTYGQTDAVLGVFPNMQYTARKNHLPEFYYFSDPSIKLFNPIQIRFGINKNKPELLSILQKGLAAISEKEKNELSKNWLKIAKKKETIRLSKKEKLFLKSHKNIVLGADQNWQPFDFKNRFGKHDGFNADLIKILAKKLDMDIQIELGPWGELQEKVKNKKLAGLVGPSKTKSRLDYMEFTKPYFSVTQVILQRNNAPIITSLEQLNGKTIAIKSGSSNIEFFQKKYPNIKQKIYNTYGDILRAVSLGEVDVGLSNIGAASYEMERNFISNIKVGFEIRSVMDDMRLGVRKDWPELTSILQKGLDAISDEELNKLLNKWLKLAAQQSQTKKVDLTKGEKQYLEYNPTIRLAYMNFWPTDDDKNNIHTEYINLLSKYGNINITLVKYDAWKDGFNSAKKGVNVHGILNLSWSKEREKNSFDYTKPYFFTPAYLIVKEENDTIKSIKDLANRSIFVKEKSITNQVIKDLKFNISPVILKTEEDLHKALSKENSKAEALLTYNLTDNLEKYKLKIAEKSYLRYGEVHIGISKPHKELHSIINKIYDAIPKNELTKIQNKIYKKTKKDLVDLTLDEKNFIKKHPKIRVHNETNWPPFNYYEFGQSKGYSVELMKLIAKNTGLNIEFISGPTWDQFLKMMKNGELDVMTNIVKNQKREEYMLFTDPFIQATMGIAVHKETKNINTFNDILNKTVSLENGFFYHDFFNKNHPETKLLVVDDGIQTLQSIAFKKADATIGFIPVMKYIASKNFITELRYFTDNSSPIMKPMPLRLSTRKDTPELLSILQKGLASITPEQQDELNKRWLGGSETTTKLNLNLTKEEKLWLREHKEIRFTADPDYLPYEAFDDEGGYMGMVSDYLEIIEDTLGIKFNKIATNSWSESLEKAKNKEVDVLSNYVNDQTLKDIHKSTKAYIKSPISIINRIDDKKINNPIELINKKVAVIKGYGYLEGIKKQYPKLNYIEVENAKDGLKGVSSGKYDAIICSMTLAAYMMSDLGLHNLQIAGQTGHTMELGLGIRKDWDILVNIINKTINSISKGTKQEIDQKWLGAVNSSILKQIKLSKKEQEWLDNNSEIKYVYDVDWAPFEWKNEIEEHTGIISDILLLIEQRSGIKFQQINTNKWSDAVDLMKTDKADMYSGVGENPERKEYLNFTKNTIFKTPYVFVSRANDKSDYLETFKAIKNKRAAVVDGYTIHGILKENVPKLPLLTVKSIGEGFDKVRDNKLDIFIVNAATAKYFINRKGYEDLKIATKTEFNLELKIALQKKMAPEALSIIDKSIETITEKELSDIYFKWTEVLREETTDWSLIYKLGGGALAVLLLVAYWNRRLKKAVDDKTSELQKLLNSFDENVIASRSDLKGNITYASNAFARISGYSVDELVGNPHKMVRHPDTPKEVFKDLWTTIKSGKVWKGEIKNKTKNGGIYWVEAVITPEFDDKNKIIGYSAIRQDITAKREVEELSRTLEQKVEERTAELNESQERFELTVEGSGDGLWEYNSKTQENWFSPQFKKMLGYEDNELPNTFESWVNNVHIEDIDNAMDAFVKHLNNNSVYDVTYRMKRKDGEYIWIRARAKSLRDENGKAVRTSGSAADITTLKEVQKDLEAQKQYIDAIMNSQTNMVISSDGICLRTANKAFFNFYNIKDTDEFIKKYGDCICDTFDTSDPDEFIQKMMGEEKWLDYVYARPHMTHKAKIIRDEKEYIFTITADQFTFNDVELKTAVFNDITDIENIRKNIEMILSNILLPILITSRESRNIIYANKYAELQYEKPVAELVGSCIDDIYSFKGQHNHIVEAIERDGKVEGLEEIFKTATGKEFTALLNVTPIVYDDQDAFIGMVTDITKQKEIEQEIRQIHKHTRESIEYASLIQGSLIPDNELFRKYFKEYFTIWHPKDVVGGDIYLFDELRNEDECMLMVIDCTGHGVPGAFVTMLVKAIERQIAAIIGSDPLLEVSPAWCLEYFNRNMKKLLQQEDDDSISNAGFDGQILYYNKRDHIVKFASARNEIFYVQNDEIFTIKGDRHSIGYKDSDANYKFKEHIIDVSVPTSLYISSDGYWDQLGGPKELSFGKKRIKRLIEEIKDESMAEQQEEFLYTLHEYQGEMERQDDVTVVGIKIEPEDLEENEKNIIWSI